MCRELVEVGEDPWRLPHAVSVLLGRLHEHSDLFQVVDASLGRDLGDAQLCPDERIVHQARQLALAELGERTNNNAKIVTGNVAAMEAAVEPSSNIDESGILAMHRALLAGSQPSRAGKWRQEQVWIGGSDTGPHGLDAGPDTIAWHLAQHHQITISAATVSRYLAKAGLVVPEPKKRPKSSYVRFEAQMPNETWQSDFTHYRLADGTDVEILTWLDDCTRMAIRVTAHRRVTTPIVLAEFRAAIKSAGIPASTLTDNGMVFPPSSPLRSEQGGAPTVRLAGIGRQGGRNAFEHELRRLHIIQKNGRPNRPTTQGKVERFQQTFKKWLRAQPIQPATIVELQGLLDEFVDEYNHRRPHRSLPHRATPATLFNTMPKALPGTSRDVDTHDRIRHDRIDKTGAVTLRVNGRLHHIGVGRTHARTHVILLIQDLHVRVVNAVTGELLRELEIDPERDYQPR